MTFCGVFLFVFPPLKSDVSGEISASFEEVSHITADDNGFTLKHHRAAASLISTSTFCHRSC